MPTSRPRRRPRSGRVASSVIPTQCTWRKCTQPVAVRPTCHPVKLELVPVGAVYDRIEPWPGRTVCFGAYPVSRRLSRGEHHVDPVVAGLAGGAGEAA